MSSLEKIEEINGLEKLGKRVAGSEWRAKQLVQRALAVLGFRVVYESWGMCIETIDGKYDVFFECMPAFSTSWSSILGKLVASRELGMETKDFLEDEYWPLDRKDGRRAVDSAVDIKWTSNPLFGCNSMEEVEMKLDLLG